MKRIVFATVVVSAAALAAVNPVRAAPQAAAVARALTEEVLERVAQSGGRTAIMQLEKAGGRVAVEAMLTRAEREGGEALAKRAAVILEDVGAPGMAVLRSSPKAAVEALDGLSGETLVRGVAALEREPALLALPSATARAAVAAEIANPGVGAVLVENLGRNGAKAAAGAGEAEVIGLARWSKDIARLEEAQQAKVLELYGRKPGVVIDYLDRHPGVLVGASVTAGAAIVEIAALVTGGEGPVSKAVKGGTDLARSSLSTPIAITAIVGGLGLVAVVLLWLTPSVLKRWRALKRMA